MNNQAKHTVTNGQSNGEYRVHLILDYVHPTYFQQRIQQNCPIQTINLSPGEVLTQTRRSIDRVCNAGSRNHPTYLIIGAQKAGTTTHAHAQRRRAAPVTSVSMHALTTSTTSSPGEGVVDAGPLQGQGARHLAAGLKSPQDSRKFSMRTQTKSATAPAADPCRT